MAEEVIGLIGGSGMGDALAENITDAKIENVETPFGSPSGAILVGKIGNRKVAFINRHGDGHKFAPSEVPYAANIFALKTLGVRCVIASGAVGSLRDDIRPRDLVLVDQFIDKTSKRQNSFFAGLGAVHCEMSHPCCTRLRQSILEVTKEAGLEIHEKGTYVCMEGPQFSTRAESLMHREWGGDLIGMTAMPEAKLAREAQMCYALIALASDYDCWREQAANITMQALLEEIIGNLQAATENAVGLIKVLLGTDISLCDENCQCRKSLELAVWTRPETIDKTQKEKLKILFE